MCTFDSDTVKSDLKILYRLLGYFTSSTSHSGDIKEKSSENGKKHTKKHSEMTSQLVIFRVFFSFFFRPQPALNIV